MNRIAQILGMKETEWKRTVLLQIYLFNLICVLLLLKPVSNALLISTWGIEGLPIVFITIAIVAYFFTKLYNNLYQKFKFIILHRGFMYVIVASLIGFIGSFYLFPSSHYLVFLFYIWVALYALVATSQFWILCNIVFNAREAKRVFGIIGSGGIAGGIAGGYLASILVEYTSNIGLMAISVVLLSLTIPLADVVWKRYNSGLKKGSLVTSKRKNKIQKFSFRRLAKDKHLVLLAMITGMGVIVAKLVDFQFQNYASIRFTDAEELTAFFGFWLSTFNVVGFIVQLFFTGRILKYFGVDKTQFILPISLLIVSSASFFLPILAVYIVLRGTEGVFKQSIQRSVNELLIMPVAPEIKSQSKTFIDVFVDSMATGLSGILLLGLMGFDLSSNKIFFFTTIIIIVLSALWVLMSFLVKNSYLNSFRAQFLKVARNKEIPITSQTLFNSVDQLFELKSDEEVEILLDDLKDFRLGTVVLLDLLQRPNPKLKLRALDLVSVSSYKYLSETIANLHNDPNLSVQVESYLSALEYDKSMTLDRQIEMLDRSDRFLSIPFVFACAAFYGLEPELQNKLSIYDRLKSLLMVRFESNEPFDESDLYTLELLKAVARGRQVGLYHYIDQLLTIGGPGKILAIRACVFTLSRKYAERLIHILADPEYGSYASENLMFYEEAIIPIVSNLHASGQMRKATLVKCFELLSKMPSQNALNYLMLFLNHKSFDIRKQVMWRLSSMRQSFPNLDYNSAFIFKRVQREIKSIKKLMSIHLAFYLQLKSEPVAEVAPADKIIRAIMKRLKLQVSKRLINVFLALGLEHNNQDIHDVYNGLVSNNKLRKSYSIEFLELLVDYKYVKILTPIVEMTFQHMLKPEVLVKNGIKPMSFVKAFSSIAKYPDKKLTLLLSRLVLLPRYSHYQKYLLEADMVKKNKYLANRIKSYSIRNKANTN